MMNLNNIKFVLSEIDGVVTEYLTGFGEMGIPMFKQFCTKDFEAINNIKRLGYGFAFISSDAHINMSLCKKKNIPFFFAEKDKRTTYVDKILNRFSLSPDNVLYVGSNYSDIVCLRMSGISMCPEDAPSMVRKEVSSIIPIYSGNGIICHVNDLLSKYSNEKRDV